MSEKKKERPTTLAIDFDGVIHKYSEGWKDGSIYDEPINNAFKGIKYLQKMGFAVFIHSSRDPQQIVDWMEENAPDIKCQQVPPTDMFWNYTEILGVTDRKLPAVAYLDDRAIKFGRSGLMSWTDVVVTFMGQELDGWETKEEVKK